MKELIIKPVQYCRIALDVIEVAEARGLLPNQLQATIWFARKRMLRVRYEDQLSLFHAVDDQWRTIHDLDDIKPFKRRVAA